MTAIEARSAELRRAAIVATNPATTFSNTGDAGINRIVALEPFLLVNNIAKNYELWRFREGAGGRETDIESAYLHNTTIFPGKDFPTIFDVDVHAAFLHAGCLIVGNHYGLVRCFEVPSMGAPVRLQLRAELQMPGDTERIVMVDGCLIASSPRGQYTQDAAQPGVLVSGRIADGLRSGRLDYAQQLPEWGTVTALACDEGAGLLAVASGPRVGVFRLETTEKGVRIGAPLWQTELPHHLQWLAFAPDRGLLAAGHDLGGDDPEGTNWDALGGGGLVCLDGAGRAVRDIALPETTAWGYGADPLVLDAASGAVYALDRRAGLSVIDLQDGASRRLYAPIEDASQGIGHLERFRDCLYGGFSRGGYRVFRYEVTGYL